MTLLLADQRLAQFFFTGTTPALDPPVSQISEIDQHTIPAPLADGSLDTRVLRSRILNLILDWELEALALDARRYKLDASADREALRNHASVYRRCIGQLSKLIGAGEHPPKS